MKNDHLKGGSVEESVEISKEWSCMARFRRFVEQMSVFREVFIGPQVFKTNPETDSENTQTSQPAPLYVWDLKP